MPPPHGLRMKSLAGLAPKTHIDTLDSGPGLAPGPQTITRTSYVPAPAPPSKRQRKAYLAASRFRAPVEDIVDSEQDVRSRNEHHGSQASFAHSVSPGLPEYQVVEASTKLETNRSNRRNRRSAATHPAGPPIPPKESRVCSEKTYEFDELEPATEPPVQQQRTARLVSTTATKPAIIRDAADDYILGKQAWTNQQRYGLNKGKKRSSHEITDDGVEPMGDANDEGTPETTKPPTRPPTGILGGFVELIKGAGGLGTLKTKAEPPTDIIDVVDVVDVADGGVKLAGDANGRGTSEPKAEPLEELPARDPARQNPPSLSRRGDLSPTQWIMKPNNNAIAGVRVYSAVCHPNFRYLPTHGEAPCFLRPDGAELRAFAENGSPAVPFGWLKITGKARSLLHHPESNYLKINQAMDQSSPRKIGALMVLRFFNKLDAARVVGWVRENTKIDVIQEKDSGKLIQVYDKVDGDVARENGRTWGMRLPNEEPVLPPRPVGGLPDRPPTRTTIRQQMKVSEPTQRLSQAERPSQPDASGSRSLRTRQYGERSQTAEARHSPVIRRWTDQHPEWSKQWKMSLVFHRTTVNKEDIERLDDGQYLNDNLIGFALKYLFEKLTSRHPDLSNRVYVHNSFFYEKLKAGRGAINYDGVKGWTAKVDLLSYDYIVVPICENLHWWVAIICNPGKFDPDNRGGPSTDEGDRADEGSSDVEMIDVAGKRPLEPPRAVTTGHSSRLPTASPGEPDLVRSDIVNLISDDKTASVDLTRGTGPKQRKKPKSTARRYNPEDPRIITLDSMGHTHSPAVAHLKKYLLAEFEHKRRKIIADVPAQVGMKAVNIPMQNNYYDCGVYLLGYMQEFVKDPDRLIQLLLHKEVPNWDLRASDLRMMWRETIQAEHKLYQDAQLALRKKAKRTPNRSASLSARTSKAREVSDETSILRGKVVPATQPPPSRPPSTPANHSVHEVDDSDTEPAAPEPRSRSKDSIPFTSSSTVSLAEGPPKQHGRIDDDEGEGDEPIVQDVLVLEPGESVLPSIEPPEDEPRFLATLPDSPELDCAFNNKEHPKAGYRSPSAAGLGGSRQQAGGPLSSPAWGPRGSVKKAPLLHTAGRFVLADVHEPVVERAVMVRREEDSIDLTDES